mgnify:CR=1 FL=1
MAWDNTSVLQANEPYSSMKIAYTLTLFFATAFLAYACSPGDQTSSSDSENTPYVELSIELLSNLKAGLAVETQLSEYARIDLDRLSISLAHPNQKKAFWINTYNGFIQYQLKNDPALYQDRSAFFSKPRINIGGELLSFDDIEHGILRASALKLSLGYLKNPFPPDIELKLRVSQIDERIHFVLNCGAASCPPIGILSADNFDHKVDQLAKSFLQSVSQFKKESNLVETTVLFSWFRGDFGGISGVRKTLIRYGILAEKSDARIEYLPYDWTLEVDHYVE